MDYRECLTNEQLSKRFKNQFDLVRYAIEVATGEINANRDSFAPIDSENVAFKVLSEIAAGTEVAPQQAVAKEEEESPFVEEIKEEKKKAKTKAKTL